MKAKIWYLTFEGLSSHGGGLASYMRQVVKAAKQAEYPIKIFQPYNREESVEALDNGFVTVVNVAIETSGVQGYWMELSKNMADAVVRTIKAEGAPAAIEVPDGYGLGYYLLQYKLTGCAELLDVPIILCAHTPISIIEDWIGNSRNQMPEWWTYRAEKWCFRAADCIVVLSKSMELYLRERDYIQLGDVVYYTLNPFISSLERTLPIEKSHTVGMASRMVKWKGLSEVLNLVKRADELNIDINFELCGEGHRDFEKAKIEYSRLFDLEKVKYLGTLKADELADRRRGWLCQLHPSKRDNLPYSVIESLSTGLPCLITKGNGVSEVLSPKLYEDLVVDYNEPDVVLTKILEIESVDLTEFDLTLFSGRSYFEERSKIIANVTMNSRKIFPFIDNFYVQTDNQEEKNINYSSDIRLTVVIPYCNAHENIGECIETVKSSIYKVNIIVVCDKTLSPDDRKKLDIYKYSDGISVLESSISGRAFARNFGVKHANTEYVALLDADDTIEPSYYTKAIWVLDSYENVGFVGCWINRFLPETGATLELWPTYNAEPMPNLVANSTNSQSLVYRRELYIGFGENDPELGQFLDDWDGMLGMLEAGWFGVMLPEALYNFRMTSTRLPTDNFYREYERILLKRHKLVKANAVDMGLFLTENRLNSRGAFLDFLPQSSDDILGLILKKYDRKLTFLPRMKRSILKRIIRYLLKYG